MIRLESVTAVRLEDTVLRLGGNGDKLHAMWGLDDRQYIALCDGCGFDEPAKAFYNSWLIQVERDPDDEVMFHDVVGYLEITGYGRYYNFGTIAIDGTFYQFLSTPQTEFAEAMEHGTTFVGAKLIYAPDLGKTWYNQDGTTPVRWEPFEERSTATMAFFNEPGGTFALPSFLQMGKDYSANTDGYVYIYSPDGPSGGTVNQLVMLRVPKGKVLDRSADEYFVSHNADGAATWTSDIARRGVVHTFPSGWVNSWLHPWAWLPSVVYNDGLVLYMMTSWGTGTAPDGKWFGKPSYLGIWVAEHPRGPWVQIHEDDHGTPEGDTNAHCYHPVIPPKCVPKDGKSFWLLWTDFQSTIPEEQSHAIREADPVGGQHLARRAMPYYGFNLQRIELITDESVTDCTPLAGHEHAAYRPNQVGSVRYGDIVQEQ